MVDVEALSRNGWAEKFQTAVCRENAAAARRHVGVEAVWTIGWQSCSNGRAELTADEL